MALQAAAVPRLPWDAPRLTAHESLTVLTQGVLGAQAGVPFMLQFFCSGVNGCSSGAPNPMRAAPGDGHLRNR
jgi:hypothetical protein